jgi:hypothetical protein
VADGMTDFIDLQSNVRERVRKLEINPGPQLFRVPKKWGPYYAHPDEITLVAYWMLPFTAYAPGQLPPIHPEAGELALKLWQTGFTGDQMGRAYMRAHLYTFSSSEFGNYTQRLEGVYTDNVGTSWRSSQNSRAVHWGFMDDEAYPPSGHLAAGEQFPKFQWRLDPTHDGATNYPDPSGGAFNYPALLDASPPERDGQHCYWLSNEGQRWQTMDGTHAFYQEGAGPPPLIPENLRPCEGNQFNLIEWRITGGEGLYPVEFWTDEPWCFGPGNPGAITEEGAWKMFHADLDILAGGRWTAPPTYYRGEPYFEFDRSADGNLFTFPGFAAYRDAVAQWCFETPDWLRNVLPWVRANRVYLPRQPSHRWQRMPLFMPWQGRLEYRIWQRVMYLRGGLWNPYDWSTQNPVTLMPPGVRPVNDFFWTGGLTGTDQDGAPHQQYTLGSTNTPDHQPAIAGGQQVLYVRYGDIFADIDPPEYLAVDARVPVRRNIAPGPDGEPVVP